jgi:hypothetical protein
MAGEVVLSDAALKGIRGVMMGWPIRDAPNSVGLGVL